jgi:hypothetical protein
MICRALACVAAEEPDAQPDAEPDVEPDVEPDAEPDADVGDVEPDADADVGDVEPDAQDADVPPPTVCEPECTGLQRCVELDDGLGARCVEPRICLGDRDCLYNDDCDPFVDPGCDPGRRCFQGNCADPDVILDQGGCITDTDCDAQGVGLLCNLEGHQCIPSGPCDASEQCPDGLVCDRSSGQCVQCVADGDCPTGLVCDDETGAHVCVESGRCAGDDQCRGDRVCNGGGCREPACQDDALDGGRGNASCETASPVGTDTLELKICGADCDWFEVQVPNGDGVLARIRYAADEGDLDLALHAGPCLDGEPDRQLASSASLSPSELLSIPRTYRDETFYVEVCPYITEFDGGTNAYTLDVEVIEGGFCLEDDFESLGGNDLPFQASALTVTERPLRQEFGNLQVCPSAPDWFKISLSPGDLLTVQIEFNGSFGDLDLALFEGIPGDLNSAALERSETIGNGELVTVVSDRFTEYAFAIYSPNGVQNAYRLSVSVDGGGQGCSDRFEPNPADENNDARASGTRLDDSPPGRITGLRLCQARPQDVDVEGNVIPAQPADEDWYTVEVPDGLAAIFRAEYNPNLGAEMEARLYTSGGDTSFDPLLGTGGVLTGVILPEGDRRVSLRLSWPGMSDVLYALTWELRPLDNLCLDDGRNNNDQTLAPQALLGVREYRGVVCPGQTDYFRFEIPAQTEFYAELLDVSEQGALKVTLYDDEGARLGQSEPGALGPRAFWRVQDQPQSIVVAVQGADGEATADYLLQTYTQPADSDAQCPDDLLEAGSLDPDADNDTVENARQVAAGGWLRSLILCPEESDWYRFTVIAGVSVAVTLQSHNPEEGDLEASLVDAFNGLVVDGVQTQNGTLTFYLDGINIFSGGPWSLEVHNNNDALRWYDLLVTVGN